MQRNLLVTLSVLFGVAPLCALPTKDTYPSYAVSLYQETKPIFEQLVAQGYKPDRMVVSSYGISAFDATGLFPALKTRHIDAFEVAEANGDDTVTLFYQAASYAKEQGDTGMNQLLTAQLSREMAVANQPGWIGTIQTLTGLTFACVGAMLFLAYTMRLGGKYERLQEQAMF